mgnify:CR=1 FL=1
MGQDYKFAIVSGGIAGCAIALRAGQKGLANDNLKAFDGKIVRLSQPEADGNNWPEGLRQHTAVLMNVTRGETLIRVTYPMAG